jgi:hypothetical protein
VLSSIAKFFLLMLMAAAMALLLPVIIPAVAIMGWRDNARITRIARQTSCRNCGHMLGDAAIERGETAWRERMSELHWRPEWGIRRRIVRDVHAVCPSCGAAYEFIPKTRQFVPTSTSGTAFNEPPAPVREP